MRRAGAIFTVLFCTVPLLGQSGPASNGLWYYQLGGSQPVRAPANPNITSLNIRGSGDLSLGYSCGSFDPVASVAHTLNEIKDGVDDMMDAMVHAATGAIASLPALILQRANPGLYDLMQNALIRAEYQVNLATKSCEQIEAAISSGKNPYQDLFVLSKGNAWKKQMGFGSNNAVLAHRAVEANAGEAGVPWVLGSAAGGISQQPIALVADLTKAGFNLSLNRSVDDPSDVLSPENTTLATVWHNPQAASAWATRIYGESTMTTCQGCDKLSTHGTGLLPEIQFEAEALNRQLHLVVSDSSPPSQSTLEEFRSPGIAVTREVIEALRTLPVHERDLFIERLTTELAMSRNIQKSLYLRRLLLTARQIPEAQALEPVQVQVDRLVQEIDKELDRLAFEHRIRQQFLGETISTILARAEARRSYSQSVPLIQMSDPKPLLDSRVVD